MNKYKLSDLCISITDGEHGSIKDSPNSNFYLLNNNNITQSGIKINANDRHISEADFKKIHKRTNLQKGDLVIATCGTLGKTLIINDNIINYEFSRSVGIIKCDLNKLIPNYLHYYFQSPSTQYRIKNIAKGGVQKHFYINDMADFEIYLPDLSTQNKIADVLSCIDDKIALNNKTNTELENMAKTVYDYWFTQFDFPDKNGTPYKTSGGQMVYNEILKREIPAGWGNCTFNYYIERITNGLNPRKNFVLGNGNNYYVTIRSLLDNDIDWNNCDKCNDEALQKINSRSQLQIGDVIFSAIGTIGRTYRIYEEPKNWNISETSFTIRPKKDIPHDFFYCLLRSPEFQLQSEHKAMGSTLKCLVMDSFCEIPCIKVDLSIANKFSTIVAPMYKQIYDNNKQNRELTKLRDYLLPLLMNGQIEVK